MMNNNTNSIELVDANDTVDDILESALNKNSNDFNNNNNCENNSWNNIDEYVQTANAKILLDTLAPEAKREHKNKLIKYVSIFLGVQFSIIFILVMTLFISMIVFHSINKDYSLNTLKIFLYFFGTYITSVIVELICILKYIVVNVFDTSISALMEIFKNQNGIK